MVTEYLPDHTIVFHSNRDWLMGCVAHRFMERRGLATSIAFIGAGFGGVLFPLMIQSLLPQVGWGWSIRILGFVLLMLCAISVAFCRSRVPAAKTQQQPGEKHCQTPGSS